MIPRGTSPERLWKDSAGEPAPFAQNTGHSILWPGLLGTFWGNRAISQSQGKSLAGGSRACSPPPCPVMLMLWWAREEACPLPTAAASCFSPEPGTEAQMPSRSGDRCLPHSQCLQRPVPPGWAALLRTRLPACSTQATTPAPGPWRFPVDALCVPCERLPLISLLGKFSGWLGGSQPADTSFTTCCWLVFLFQGRRGCGCKMNLWLFFFPFSPKEITVLSCREGPSR